MKRAKTMKHQVNYNYTAFEKVLNHIKDHPQQFDMHFYHHHNERCGTLACIAGWTCMLLDKSYDFDAKKIPSEYYIQTAREILALSQRETAIFNCFQKQSKVLQLLETAVQQQNLPVHERQSLEQIATNHGIEINWEDH